eukprot:1160739-Pelagomonas_calceolata.AAC.16
MNFLHKKQLRLVGNLNITGITRHLNQASESRRQPENRASEGLAGWTPGCSPRGLPETKLVEIRKINLASSADTCTESHVFELLLTFVQAGHPDLANLRTQFQYPFISAPPRSASSLRHFMNQADALGLAPFVSASECRRLRHYE